MSVRLGLAVDATRIAAVALRRGHAVWAAEATYAGPDDLAAALAALAAERPRGARRASVALSSDLVRVKTIEGLPRLRRRDLVAHVRLNSRRYFLQNGCALVTDAQQSAQGTLMAGAPARLVEAIADGLDGAGLRCTAILPAALLRAGPVPADVARAAALAPAAPVSLLPDGLRAEAARDVARSLRRWAVVAVLSLGLAALSWFLALARAERGAERELRRLRPAVEAALAAERDLDATGQALAAFAAAQSELPRRARFLADLTRALPDSGFLVSLRLDPDGAGVLSGYAPHAAAALARLERTGLVRGAAFDGPTTREVVAGREVERFALRFRLAATGTDAAR